MDTLGKHLLIEFHDGKSELLDDEEFICSLMVELAAKIGATVVDRGSHRFSPHGVTAMLLIQESHLSVHTWPEVGYAAFDFYTCGNVTVDDDCVKWVADAFSCRYYRTYSILRGCRKRTLSIGNEFDHVL